MTKYLFSLIATAAFAQADMARSGGAGDPVLEIVTFRLVDGTDQKGFLKAAAGTQAALKDQGALVRRVLTVDDDGLWTDVVEWTSMDAALTAAETVTRHPDFAPFGAMIDGASVNMRHAHIRWRMD